MNQPPPSLLHAVRPWLADDRGVEAMAFGSHRLGYRALAGHALALSERLRALGVQPGDRVAGLFSPRPEAVIALLACWLAGATLTGLNPRYRREEQRQILVDSQAKVLLSIVRDGDRELGPDLDDHEATLRIRTVRFGPGFGEGELPAPTPAGAVPAQWDAALHSFDDRVPAVVIYTSGSTGRPKGALITHQGLSFRSYTLHHDRFAIPHIRLLLDLPVNHIGALASGIGVALVAGGLLVMAEQFDPAATLAAVRNERLHVLSGVPTMLARIAAHPDFETADLSSLRFVNWGAGPINEQVLRRLLRATPALFSQQYGMTESNGPIVFTPPTRDVDVLLHTTGKPDPRLEVRIADEEDQALPSESEGEVQVRLPYPFAGYLGNPESSGQAFTTDGYLKTGDRALLRSDGYLVFRGRSKEMYKSGGFNVYPREVEIVLESHPAIRAAAVLGVDDPVWGQVGHAFVELKSELAAADIVAWCRERLANYKVPKAIVFLDAMPRTSVDKIDRKKLSERGAGAV
ncbi:MAG: long-chain fatty acid--CoA ligase [Burkholderiales bacterium]|nr:MAG: long-chain fatty acid--CoA ligase [Burkholderiales bacterium]